MADDIRIAIGFWGHHKTVKLKRRMGLEGIESLLKLWTWTAQNRPDGTLDGMDVEDLEISSGWNGAPGKFIEALCELRWLDHEDGVFSVHGWAEHQPWVVGAGARKQKATAAARARWENTKPVQHECHEHATSMRPAMPSTVPCLYQDQDQDQDQTQELNTVGQEAESSELKPMNIFAEEPTSAQEPEQEPDDPEYSGFTVYHAEGEMRINKRDFAAWQKAYSNLDLAAELQALSDWTRETREWPKKSAFMACSAALRKKNESRTDTSWRKYRSWAEGYAAKRAALTGEPSEESPDVLDTGAKMLAEYIAPDGFTEDEAGRLIAWILAKPERTAHVPTLANLTDEVPGWGMLITWASNGSRGLDVGDDPRTWRAAANG